MGGYRLSLDVLVRTALERVSILRERGQFGHCRSEESAAYPEMVVDFEHRRRAKWKALHDESGSSQSFSVGRGHVARPAKSKLSIVTMPIADSGPQLSTRVECALEMNAMRRSNLLSCLNLRGRIPQLCYETARHLTPLSGLDGLRYLQVRALSFHCDTCCGQGRANGQILTP